jgi:hypothetical protein
MLSLPVLKGRDCQATGPLSDERGERQCWEAEAAGLDGKACLQANFQELSRLRGRGHGHPHSMNEEGATTVPLLVLGITSYNTHFFELLNFPLSSLGIPY